MYDGESHCFQEVDVVSGSFAGDEFFVYDNFPSIMYYSEAGISNSFTYNGGSGTDTNNYKITATFGTLKITKVNVPIIVTANSDDKIYDGTELRNDRYTYNDEVLVDGDSLTANVNGSITDAGTVSNVVTEIIIEKGTEDVSDNYTIGEPVNGTLTINKRDISISSKEQT